MLGLASGTRPTSDLVKLIGLESQCGEYKHARKKGVKSLVLFNEFDAKAWLWLKYTYTDCRKDTVKQKTRSLFLRALNYTRYFLIRLSLFHIHHEHASSKKHSLNDRKRRNTKLTLGCVKLFSAHELSDWHTMFSKTAHFLIICSLLVQ